MRQQRTFDEKPLGTGVCYVCGHVLFTSVDYAYTYLVNKPDDLNEEDAPANAYLKAVPNCNLTFVYPEKGNSTKERWYACNYCYKASIPQDQYVGNVFDESRTSLKPVVEWDMCFPKEVTNLRNKYETGQVALCGLFSNTVKQANASQYSHVQGEVNSIAKLDRHFYGLFGFIAVKDSDIWVHSPSPDQSFRIKKAIRWFHENNHLYSTFFSQYETLLRYAKPSFLNPSLLEQHNLSIDKVLEDEAVGLAFPVDAKYFDQFPIVSADDIAGKQYPKAEHECLQQLVTAKYGEKYLDCKAFPHLHPWGNGGWYYKCGMPFQAHVKIRLFNIRGHFAADPAYAFFKYDYMTKVRLRMHNSRKVVNVQHLTSTLTAANTKQTDPYAVYGTEIPRIIPGSKQYWRSFGLDLVAFVEQRGLPDFFLTLTAYDGWPHVQTTLREGWGACASIEDVQDLAKKLDDHQPVGFHPEVSVLAAEKRYQWFMSILCSDKGGPLGLIQDKVVKKEYQRRGAVHWHILLWVKPGTAPQHAVMAEMPRGSNTDDLRAAYLRKLVEQMQRHKTCYASRCFRGSHGKTLAKCKYGFPFKVPELKECLDEDGVRYLYVRRHKEDALVVPYNPEIAILWGAAHNVQRVSKHGFEMYLAKYVSKPEPSFSIQLPENASEPQRYLRTRVVGSVEALEVLMGFHQNQMSRQVMFLQTELVPTQSMLKPQCHLASLADDDEDIYLRTKFEIYLMRPEQLAPLTYPEFFRWWRTASATEQERASQLSHKKGETIQTKTKGADDFADYLEAKSKLDTAMQSLADLLADYEVLIENSEELLTLTRSMEEHDVPPSPCNCNCAKVFHR